ncbi:MULTISPECIES: 2-hydroxymuconate tautomerase [Sphingomonadaceae]|uniref:2-hydroxymuconate tautomerase n=1 Tax=Sphingomonadales TaxID=204457 RepID=UPI0005CC6E78|nr:MULTISPECIES: 2-hydroxymuconate tautomerase [Sphingomonadaceae]KKC24312.1 hypothetical protein WP12_20070 [Sphingomonas sp. SRS2]
MPIVEVHIMEGRTVAQKRAMVAAVTEAVSTTMIAPASAVRVIIHELTPEHYGIGGTTVGEKAPGHLGELKIEGSKGS